MDFHKIRIKGDFKTDNIYSKDGVESIGIEDSTGKITFKKDLRIENLSPSGDYVLVSDSNGDCSFSPRTVPPGTVILFESDTAMNGYTLRTEHFNELLYITKGSAAGGQTGGSGGVGAGAKEKLGGGIATWGMDEAQHTHTISSQSGHFHTTSSHILTEAQMPAHWHYLCRIASLPEISFVTGEERYLQYTNSYGGASNHGYQFDNMVNTGPTKGKIGDSGSGYSHTHGNTGYNSWHNHWSPTGNNTSMNSDGSGWRPYGTNFTRQEKL